MGLIAYYTNGSKTIPAQLTIMLDRQTVEVIGVSGKREARKVALERGAKCWNF